MPNTSAACLQLPGKGMPVKGKGIMSVYIVFESDVVVFSLLSFLTCYKACR